MTKASFFYWGPLLLQTKVEEQDLFEVGKLCERQNSLNHRLAGHLNDQFLIDNTKLEKILEKYLNIYKQVFSEYYAGTVDFYIQSSWVNFMKRAEFNPPHSHEGDFSAVLFLSMPDEIKKENQNFKGSGGVNSGPGELRFFTGVEVQDFINEASFLPDRGDLFIFPAKLSHMVAPFKSDVERISVAFNMKRKPK
tara:strand:+ start:977 stop:1558 length:582 start_codon:yes stop_codon:yes gene_type:complete